MKYIFLTGFLIVNLYGFSQNTQIGLKAGYILSNQDVSENLDYKPLSSFQLGLSYSINISDKTAIQPELLYTKKGSRIEDGKLKLDYLELPLLFLYKFNKISVIVGPQFSHAFRAKWEDAEEVHKENISLSNIGVVLGLNYSLNEQFILGVRVQKDLLDNFTTLNYYPNSILQNSGVQDPAIPSGLAITRTQALQVYLAYFF